LSPLQFLLFKEALFSLLNDAELNGQVRGIKIRVYLLFHLFFTNNALFIVKVSDTCLKYASFWGLVLAFLIKSYVLVIDFFALFLFYIWVCVM